MMLLMLMNQEEQEQEQQSKSKSKSSSYSTGSRNGGSALDVASAWGAWGGLSLHLAGLPAPWLLYEAQEVLQRPVVLDGRRILLQHSGSPAINQVAAATVRQQGGEGRGGEETRSGGEGQRPAQGQAAQAWPSSPRVPCASWRRGG